MLKDARKGSKKVTFLIAANTSKVTFGVLSGTPPEPIILRFGVLPWGHWMMKGTKKVELSILGLLGGPPWFRVEWALKAKATLKKTFPTFIFWFCCIFTKPYVLQHFLHFLARDGNNNTSKLRSKRAPKTLKTVCFMVFLAIWAASGRLLDSFWTA